MQKRHSLLIANDEFVSEWNTPPPLSALPQPWVLASVYCFDWQLGSMIAIHNVDRLVQRQLRVDRPMGSMTHDILEIAKALFA